MVGTYASAFRMLTESRNATRYDEGTEQLVLANLYRLFPEMSWSAMCKAASEVSFNQERAIFDLSFVNELVCEAEFNDFEGLAGSKTPCIYACSHVASYRLSAPLLMQRGVRLTIVVDVKVARAQKDEFFAIFERFRQQSGLPSDALRFRDTSESGLLIGMARDLRAGRSLMLYLDGNKGASEAVSTDHAVEVPFLGKVVKSRIGIPMIAASCRVPIVPLKMERGQTPSANIATLMPPMYFDGGNRQRFIQDSLSLLWAGIADQVASDPTQWEALRYAHKYVHFENSQLMRNFDNSKHIIFNHRRFGFKSNNGNGELFDRERMAVIPVKGTLLDILEYISSSSTCDPISHDRLGVDALKWLAIRNMVINATGKD